MINIAIVEDNGLCLRALEEKLAFFADISITKKARNGQEILNILEKNQDVDLIFMDIEMPILNGIDATTIIRQKYPAIKVVMITMYDDDNYIFRAIQAGADSYKKKRVQRKFMKPS